MSGTPARVVERFRLVSANKMDYEVTIEDPTVFTQPVTLSYDLQRACASRIPNSLAASRIEATLRGAWRLVHDNEVRSHDTSGLDPAHRAVTCPNHPPQIAAATTGRRTVRVMGRALMQPLDSRTSDPVRATAGRGQSGVGPGNGVLNGC